MTTKVKRGLLADAILSAIAALGSNGLIGRTADGTVAARTITGTTGKVSVTNGDGVSGNPTLTLPAIINQEGVKFPSTQVPSADPNTLDDYEEGSWTPAFSATGSTFSYEAQTGRYIKIGKFVFCWFEIRLNTSGNTLAANALSITGLPFQSDSAHVVDANIYWKASTTSYISMSGSLNQDSTTLLVRGLTAAATTSSINAPVNASAGLHATNASAMRAAFCYIAAA